MAQEGNITGFLDWESAGWYPEYWDFTTALRFTLEDFWWYSFVTKLGGESYLAELDCEKALTSLTSASYYWWIFCSTATPLTKACKFVISFFN